MKKKLKYSAQWGGQALDPTGNIIPPGPKAINLTGESPMAGLPMVKLLENTLKLAQDDQLDGCCVIVITKDGEMQMAYHAKNAALLHLHAGRLMAEIEDDVFVKKQQRTLLA